MRNNLAQNIGYIGLKLFQHIWAFIHFINYVHLPTHDLASAPRE